MGASSGARRRRGSPRPCRDRNRHQNSHAQSRSVRTPDGRSQGDQSRSVGRLDGKSRGGTRSSSIGQIRRKLRQAIPSPMGYPNPSPMHNTGHTRSNTLENNKDSLVAERGVPPDKLTTVIGVTAIGCPAAPAIGGSGWPVGTATGGGGRTRFASG